MEDTTLKESQMDPFLHLAYHRLADLHATADAIRLERTAAASETRPATDPDTPDPTPALAVVVGERGGPCEPEAKAA
jgi:hypothetical protein